MEAGFSRPDDALGAMKQAALFVLSTAAEKFGDKLGDEQFVLLPAADILIDVFAADSMAARAREPLHQAAATVFLIDAADRVEVAARNALAAMLDGSELHSAVNTIREMFNRSPVKTSHLRSELAAAALSLGRYPFA